MRRPNLFIDGALAMLLLDPGMDALPLSQPPCCPLPPLTDPLTGPIERDLGGEIGLDSKPSLLDLSESGLIIDEALLPCIAAAKADVGPG